MDGEQMAVEYLEGWVALPEAAERLGMSRQGLHDKVRRGKIHPDDVKLIEGSRTLVISEEYVKGEVGLRNYYEERAKAQEVASK